MNTPSIILVSLIALLFSADLIYLYLSKRKGKCVGCAVSAISPKSQGSACKSCPIVHQNRASCNCK